MPDLPFGNLVLFREAGGCAEDWARLVGKVSTERRWGYAMVVRPQAGEHCLEFRSDGTLSGLDLGSVSAVCFACQTDTGIAESLEALAGYLAMDAWTSKDDFDALAKTLAEAQAEIRYMEESLSWRITRPLRLLVAGLRRCLGMGCQHAD
jgi:hypothetical protein